MKHLEKLRKELHDLNDHEQVWNVTRNFASILETTSETKDAIREVAFDYCERHLQEVPDEVRYMGNDMWNWIMEQDEGIKAAVLPLVRVFELYARGIDPEEALALAKSPYLANLTVLALGNNNIRAKGARALAKSPHLANLKELDLGVNRIGDEGAQAIANSTNLSTLVLLNLCANHIGDEGAQALAKSPHLANLKELNLSVNRIGDEGARAIREAYPNVKVII